MTARQGYPDERPRLGRPQVMGVLNVTPDSFSDGGAFNSVEAACQRAQIMVSEGVDIIDVGGESSRPGAEIVGDAEELARVIPVIRALRSRFAVPISIDTTKPVVMQAACAAGASMINDVNALRSPGAIEAARDSGAMVCLMHRQGTPASMQLAPHYDDVVADVTAFLRERVAACMSAGIDADRLVLDPGIGFGKNLEHNLALLAALRPLCADRHPVLIGVSRKSMFGALLGRTVDQRLAASLAAAAVAVFQGVAIVRAHDIRATVDAVAVAYAIRNAAMAGAT
ncbi:dihydropteroate synthase [Flagellatimonas centrodinii]|uniref:dihydropteroate synthase n=1 Tax=Flagellatimonas centrodinii TaxID=2806210 RepID=UPI001FF01836|nr:dihydropteroate synthase [Flagellatimonas centrodinii]ULQ45827.1 dihydropteroate synthase [Flagellatimonas centrodinii]